MRATIALVAFSLAALLAGAALADTASYSYGTSSMTTYAQWSANLRTNYARSSEPIGQGRGGYYWAGSASSNDFGYCDEALCDGWGTRGVEIFNFPLSITPSQVTGASIQIYTDSHNDACCQWYGAIGFDVYINGVKVGSDTSASAGLTKTSTIAISSPSTTLKNGANDIYIVYNEARTGYGILTRVSTVSIGYQTASANTPPTASRSSPSASSVTALQGQSQAFTVSCSDADSNLRGVSWTFDWFGDGGIDDVASHAISGLSATDSYTTPSLTNTGTHTVTAYCYDTVTTTGSSWTGKSWTQSPSSGASTSWSVTVTAPAPTTGDLSVTSTPGGADIYVDGQWVGTGSATARSLSAGSHAVKCTESGYSDYSTTATVTAGQTVTVNCALQAAPPATGTIQVTVTSSPAASGGADIYVDGTWKGTYDTAPIPNIAAGSRTVRCSKSGYNDYTATVTVPAGGSVSVQCSLTAVASAPVSPSAGQDCGGTIFDGAQPFPPAGVQCEHASGSRYFGFGIGGVTYVAEVINPGSTGTYTLSVSTTFATTSTEATVTLSPSSGADYDLKVYTVGPYGGQGSVVGSSTNGPGEVDRVMVSAPSPTPARVVCPDGSAVSDRRLCPQTPAPYVPPSSTPAVTATPPLYTPPPRLTGQFARPASPAPPTPSPSSTASPIRSGPLRIVQLSMTAQPGSVGPSGQTTATTAFRVEGQGSMAPVFAPLYAPQAPEILSFFGMPILTVRHEIRIMAKGENCLGAACLGDKEVKKIILERRLVPRMDPARGLKWYVEETGKGAVEVRSNEEALARLYSVTVPESFTGTDLGIPGCHLGWWWCDQERRHTLFAEVRTEVDPVSHFFWFSGSGAQVQRSNEVTVTVTKTEGAHADALAQEPTQAQLYLAKERFWQGVSDYASVTWYLDTQTKELKFVGDHYMEFIQNPINLLHPSKSDIAVMGTEALAVSLNGVKLADLSHQVAGAVMTCDPPPGNDWNGLDTQLQAVARKISNAFVQKQEPLAGDLESARDLAKCYQGHVSDQWLKGVFALAQVEAERELKEGASGISGQFVAGQDPAIADAVKVLSDIAKA